MSANFRIHGSFDFTIDERILVIRKVGPFDLEFELAYEREAVDQVAHMERTGPYAVLMIYERSVLTTPDAMQYLVERVQEGTVPTPGCVAQAIVAAADVEGHSIMPALTEQYFRVRQLARGTGRFFSDRALARSFLEELLARAGVQHV